MSKTETITLTGRKIHVTGGDGADLNGELDKFIDALHRASVRGFEDLPLPQNIAWKIEAGPLSLCFVQLEPALRRLDVIDPASPVPYGPGALYKARTLATPWVVLKVPFLGGMITNRCELFYRNDMLRSLDDPVFWPNLYNVSPNAYGCKAWICTQYLYSENPKPGVTNGLDALCRHLWGGGFNRSSEHHEGSSGFSKAVAEKVDPRVTDIDRWEQESAKDWRFITTVNWKPVGMSVRQLIEAELSHHRVRRDLGNTSELVNVLMTGLNGNGKKA